MPLEPKQTVKTTKGLGTVTLAKDQVWQVNGTYAQIVTVGKRLVHYKMAKSLTGRATKIAPVRIGTCEAVQEYLTVNKAVLVKSPSRATPGPTGKPVKQEGDLSSAG